jgi:hypothetical protein
MMRAALIIVSFAALLESLASVARAEAVGPVRFIGSLELPQGLTVDGTRVGGLSGLDYDAANDRFLAITDDRSDVAPARFYALKIRFADGRLADVQVETATTLRQADGTSYPNARQGGDVPDPESIRIDPAAPTKLWWSSEGDRPRGLAPSLRQIDAGGRALFTMPIPAMFAMQPNAERGPRNNLAFEALSFSSDGQTLWVGMEGALYEDGPLTTPDAGTVSRFSHYARDGQLLGQFAYPIDAVPGRPGAGKAADNGVTEILALDAQRLLVLERAAIQDDAGVFRNSIRLYEADLADASDVSSLPALAGAAYTPMRKRLIANLGALMNGARIDNIEGMSWGPSLANGHRCLVFVSDDNFNKAQVTQVLAFEILP